MSRKKAPISIGLFGHVDCGKSTLAGHLIYQVGGIDERTLAKFERQAQEIGKGSFKYAWVLDKRRAERERGITINVNWWKIETLKFVISLVDTPGHRDFLKNTITGAACSDVAFLVVDASKGCFEWGMSETGQTRQHLTLAFCLGVKQVVIVVNKMDEQSVNWRESRFLEVQKEMKKLLKKVGYKPSKVPIIPISGWVGDNIVSSSRAMSSWWKKNGSTPWSGMTILECIDSLIKAPRRRKNKPLRLALLDVYKIGGIGTVGVGVINSGFLKQGQKLVVQGPSHLKRDGIIGGKKEDFSKISTEWKGETSAHSIESFFCPMEEAEAGDWVGIRLPGIQWRSIRRGAVIGDAKIDPPRRTIAFVAQIVVLEKPKSIKVGFRAVVDCHTTHVECRVDAIMCSMDKRSGKILDSNPSCLQRGQGGVVVFRPISTQSMVVEKFTDYPRLGRIAVRTSNLIVAVGIVKRVVRFGNSSEAQYLLEMLNDGRERKEWMIESLEKTFEIRFLFGEEKFQLWKVLLF